MAYQPKSYKKFVATAATATLVASAIVPVASANGASTAAFTDVSDKYKDAVDYLVKESISTGLTETEFGVQKTITRGDAAIMLASALGLKDNKDAAPSGFSDVPTRGVLAINALKAAGVINGKTATRFGFEDNLTRGEVALMLAKANAYNLKGDVSKLKFTDVNSRYAEAVAGMVEAGITSGKTATSFGTSANILRGEFAIFIYKAEGAPTATAEVASVSATNLKEVVVNFNSAVSKADVKTTDFAVKDNTVAAVTLNNDNKTAVLTLGTALPQQSDVVVTTKKSLKFSNGASLEADVVKTINVTDVTIPVAQSIELTGPNTFEVNFSEPVKDVASEVLINNGVYGVAEKTLSTDGRTLTVKLSASSLPEGSYEVKVSGYSDYANFAAMSKTFTLAYVKDTTAPSVKLVSASQSEVVVEFDKAVTQDNGNALTKDFFYHTYSAWKPVSVSTTDNKKFTLKFADADAATQDFILPEGNVTVTALKSVGDNVVVDMWGNELAADAKLAATISSDKVAPTVTKVEAKAENQVVVTFSEKVDLTNAKFTITDSNGKKVLPTVTAAAFDEEKLTVNLDLSAKLSGGNYTVAVSDVVDKSLSQNKITAITLPFTVTDKTPMDLTTVEATVVTNDTAKEQYVYVTFPEAVSTTGAYSALNKDNYLVGGKTLGSNDKVELFGTDNKRVKITVKYVDDVAVVTAGTTDLTMGRIADAAGNAPTSLSTIETIVADTAPTTFTAKAVGLNKLELTFAAELKTVTAAGITVDGKDNDTVKTTVAAVDKVEVANGKTVVTVTLKAEENLADKSATSLAAVSVGIVDNKLETITGQKLVNVTDVTAGNVKDGIAPELASVDPVTVARTSDKVATITVDFDEALDTLDPLAATDLVVTDANGKVYVAGRDYTVARNLTDASKLEITVTAADEATLDKLNGTKFAVATTTTVNYLDDAAGNTIKVFTAKQTKTNLADNVNN